MIRLLLFTTIFYAFLILVPNYRHYPFSDAEDFLLILAHLFLSTSGLFSILFLLSLNKYIWSLLLPLLSILTGVTAFFVWQVDISINPSLVESICLTNTEEMLSYTSMPLLLLVILHLAASVFFIVWRFKAKWSKKEIAITSAIAVLSTTLFLTTEKFRPFTLSRRAPFAFYPATKEYLDNKTNIKQTRRSPASVSDCNVDSLTVVLVIGEALRADHIQINGYHRRTMPLMEKRNVISLPAVHSPYTHTAACLPYMLTRAEPNLTGPIQEEYSFIHLFKQCGFRTIWLANQNPMKTFAYFVNECDTILINKPHLSDYSNTPKYDSDLLPAFRKFSKDVHPRKLIIVHLSGNHWWYNKNMHPDFTPFQPVLTNKIFSAENKEKMINSYDNVTLHTDYVLDEIIGTVENENSWVLFLSDHGQSFGENGKWLHANDMPAEQNPACFFWFSKRYRQNKLKSVSTLECNRLRPVDTAFLFHTMLAGSGITTNTPAGNYNLFEPCP